MNNQTLQQFIEQKTQELQQQYRKVEVISYVSVQLRKEGNGGGVGESFLSTNTALDTFGREVTVSEFPVVETTIPHIENGTSIQFHITRKGKRKPERMEVYFLWEVECGV